VKEILIAATLVALAVACAGGGSKAVTIAHPANGDSVASDLTVHLQVAGARVVPASGARAEGEGHYHIFVDIDPTPRDQLIPTGPGIYHLGNGADSLRLTGLAPGSHRLIGVFAYGDHVPIPTVGTDTVTVVVRP
jgi:hypothetical protein